MRKQFYEVFRRAWGNKRERPFVHIEQHRKWEENKNLDAENTKKRIKKKNATALKRERKKKKRPKKLNKIYAEKVQI